MGMGKLKGTVSFSSDRVDGELRLSDSCACRCAEVCSRLSPTPFGLVLRPGRIDAGRATVDTVPLDSQYRLRGCSSHAHMTVGQHDALISSRFDSTRLDRTHLWILIVHQTALIFQLGLGLNSDTERRRADY